MKSPGAPRQIYLPRSNGPDRIREINRVKLQGKAPPDLSRLFKKNKRKVLVANTSGENRYLTALG